MDIKQIIRALLLIVVTIFALTYLSFNVNKFENIYEWYQGIKAAPSPFKVTVKSGDEVILERYYPSGAWAGYIFVDQDIRNYLNDRNLKVYLNDLLIEKIMIYQFEDFILLSMSDNLFLAFIHNNYGENLKNLVLTSSLMHSLPYGLTKLDEVLEFTYPGDFLISSSDEPQQEVIPIDSELRSDSLYKIAFSYSTNVPVDLELDQPTPVIILSGNRKRTEIPVNFTWTLDTTGGDERSVAIYYLADQDWEDVKLTLEAKGQTGEVLYRDIKISKVDGGVDLPRTYVMYLEHKYIYKQLLSTLITSK